MGDAVQIKLMGYSQILRAHIAGATPALAITTANGLPSASGASAQARADA
jgi:hypothetical protein